MGVSFSFFSIIFYLSGGIVTAKLMKSIFISIILMISLSLRGQSLQFLWATPPVLKTPESVYYMHSIAKIFVSNVNGNPSAKDGNGFISELTDKGKIKKLKWATGLNAPKGMAVVGNYLYVTDIDELVRIDLRNPNNQKRYASPGAIFLNDAVADKDGNIYISDTELDALFYFNGNKIILWKKTPLFNSANGLAMENGVMLLGVKGYLLKIYPETKAIQKFIPHKGIIDGLIPLGKGKYLVSNWAGKIQILERGKPAILLSNTTNKHINAADMGYNKLSHTVFIPTFYNNRVVAKKLICTKY